MCDAQNVQAHKHTRPMQTHTRCAPPPLPLDQVIKNRAVERTKSNGFLCGWCIFIFFFLHIPKVTMRIINMRWLHFMSYRIHVYIFSTRRRMVLQTTKQKKKSTGEYVLWFCFCFCYCVVCLFLFAVIRWRLSTHTHTQHHIWTTAAQCLR